MAESSSSSRRPTPSIGDTVAGGVKPAPFTDYTIPARVKAAPSVGDTVTTGVKPPHCTGDTATPGVKAAPSMGNTVGAGVKTPAWLEAAAVSAHSECPVYAAQKVNAMSETKQKSHVLWEIVCKDSGKKFSMTVKN